MASSQGLFYTSEGKSPLRRRRLFSKNAMTTVDTVSKGQQQTECVRTTTGGPGGPDTENWVKVCPSCQLNNPIKKVAHDLHPIVVHNPWSVLGMDLIGALPATPRGNVYVLTMTDLFTKWVIAKPLKTKTAAEVASKLTLYLKLGLVDKIITDQRKEFVNELNNDLCEILHMKHCISSAYHPQTNGQDERTNRNIKDILKKYINEKQNNWDNYVRDAVFAINTSQQTSTRHTPYLAMFNWHPRTPLSCNPLDDDFEIGSVEDGIDERTQEAETMFDKIRQNIGKAPRKQKKDYGSRHKNTNDSPISMGNEILKTDMREKG